MKTLNLSTLFFTGLLFSSSVLADKVNLELNIPESFTLKQKIEQAIDRFEKRQSDRWSFQLSRYELEEGDVTESIEQYDPSQAIENQWTLLSINKKVPTKKQRAQFLQNKQKNLKDDKSQGFSINLQKLIRLETLELSAETSDHLSARFKVNLKKLGKKASKKLLGTLKYSKTGQFIETIEVVNLEPFSPMLTADISDFALTMEFTQIDKTILPKQINLAMKGTFAFWTEIDEISTDTYSHYRSIAE